MYVRVCLSMYICVHVCMNVCILLCHAMRKGLATCSVCMQVGRYLCRSA